MAESDPRKVRPFGKPPEPRDFATEEDPLVELARIVSEDRAQPARPAKAAPPVESVGRSPYTSDLESELLQELESSFAPRGPARKAPARATPAQPPQPAETYQLLRSIETQLGEVERRVQTPRPRQETADDLTVESPPARPRHHDNMAAETFSPNQGRREPDPLSTPFPRVDARQRAAAASAPPQQARQEQPRQDNRAARAAAETPLGQRPTATPRDVASGDENATRLPLRRRDRSAAGEDGDAGALRRASPMLPAAGWNNVIGEDVGSDGSRSWEGANPAEARKELRSTLDDADDPRIQARRPAGFESDRPEVVDELEPTYSDPSFEAQWDTEASNYDGSDADEPRVAPARPLDSPFATGRRPSRSRKGLLTAAGVLGVLVLGGGVLALLRPGDQAPSGAPPVISAPAGDSKVQAPEQQQAEGETAGEAVYNRVAGAPPAAEEQVVEGAEEPREISRIVLPPPEPVADEALVKPVGEGEAADASTAVAAAPGASSEEVAIGPRRVRTYAVRPDGTITASGAAPAPAAAQPQPQAAAPATPIEPVRVATTSVKVGDAPATAPRAGSAPAQAQPAVPAGADPTADAALAGDAPAAPPALDESGDGAASATDPATADRGLAEAAGAPRAAESAAAPSAGNSPAVVASLEPAEPEPTQAAPPADAPAAVASVAPTASDPAPAASAPAGGGYVIQVSSQRSMNEAQSALAAVKQRYADVIGNLESDVQQADLGEKGVYYRARVGRWATRAEAIEVCEALQAAGGTCFVTQ